MSEHGHHPAPASPVEQRVAALEALLTERGLVPEGFIEEITRRYESEIGPMNGAKVVARPGPTPSTRSACEPMAPPRSPSLALAARKAITWWSWRTPLPCITSSCARCARATPGRCWGCRQRGTKILRPAPGWSESPGRCWPRWVSTARRCRDPGVGLLRRGPLPRPPRPPASDREHDGGRAGRDGDPRLDDRRGPPVTGTLSLSELDLPGETASWSLTRPGRA